MKTSRSWKRDLYPPINLADVILSPGLLWNLSSHDLLKEQLAIEAVKPLTDCVLVPCSGISEGEDPKLELLADPEIFYNATGCLRYYQLKYKKQNFENGAYLFWQARMFLVVLNSASITLSCALLINQF